MTPQDRSLALPHHRFGMYVFPPSPSIIHTDHTRQFLDEITLTLSPSPSFITRTPPVVLTVPTNLWEDLVDIRFIGESSVWDCYPRPTPRTPVALNDDAIESHDQCVDTAGSSHTSHSVLTSIDAIVRQFRCR